MMAYTITKQSGVSRGYIKSFQVDFRNEVDTLPVSPECQPGSDCIVSEDASVWLLNTEGNEWVELGGGT